MDLLSLIVAIALIGLVVWLVVTYIPMPEQFKTLIIVLTIVVVVLYVLRVIGVFSGLPSIRVG